MKCAMAKSKELISELCERIKSVVTDHRHFDVFAMSLLIAEVAILTCIIKFVPCELAS